MFTQAKGEVSLEEGGLSRAYSHWRDPKQRRLGKTAILWDHMHSSEHPFEEINEQGEIWDGTTLREAVMTNLTACGMVYPCLIVLLDQ